MEPLPSNEPLPRMVPPICVSTSVTETASGPSSTESRQPLMEPEMRPVQVPFASASEALGASPGTATVASSAASNARSLLVLGMVRVTIGRSHPCRAMIRERIGRELNHKFA